MVFAMTDSKGFPRQALGSAVRCASAALALCLVPTLAMAQQVAEFSSNTAFGDSYADVVLQGASPNCPVVYPQCRFSNGTNFVDSLNSIFGTSGSNFAVGGAQSGNINVNNFAPGGGNLPGFTQQIDRFFTTGAAFSPEDLITISVGGNDQMFYNAASTPAQIQGLATSTATTAVGNIQRLVDKGARNIIWNPSGNTAFMPIDRLFTPGISAAQYTNWAETLFDQAQQKLAPLAASGVRIFLFDFPELQAKVAASPTTYGFASTSKCWYIFDTSTVGSCLAKSADARNSTFYWDGIHLTSAGFALMANYMANQVNAPLAVAPQVEWVAGTANAFANSILGQLDAGRVLPGSGVLTTSADQRWSVYVGVNYDRSEGEAQAMLSGYESDASGGHLGVEYASNSQFRAGIRLGFSRPETELAVQNASFEGEAIQMGGYLSYNAENWFADGLLAFSHQDFDVERQGVVGIIQGDSDAETFSLTARTGYLMDVGSIKLGPVLGLTTATTDISTYTESGDSLLTNRVEGRDVGTLTGSVGVQLRLPMVVSSGLISPYISLTLEHELEHASHTLVTTQSSTPLLPVRTEVDTGDATYSKLAAGTTAVLGDRLSLTLDASHFIDNDYGSDVMVGGTLRVAF